jgi:uncharacterized membrane protein YphA (DoxX/SURF4 family)
MHLTDMYSFSGNNWIQLLCLWVLSYFFSMAGITKFTGAPANWPENFNRWGYSKWFRYLIGVIELVCAFTILFQELQLLSLSVLCLIMFGAIFTLVYNQENVIWVTFPLLVIAVILIFLISSNQSLFGWLR